jgi:hypothetical protein
MCGRLLVEDVQLEPQAKSAKEQVNMADRRQQNSSMRVH